MSEIDRTRQTDFLAPLLSGELEHFEISLPENYILLVSFLAFDRALDGFFEEFQEVLMTYLNSPILNEYPIHLFLSMDNMKTSAPTAMSQRMDVKLLVSNLWQHSDNLSQNLFKENIVREKATLMVTKTAKPFIVPKFDLKINVANDAADGISQLRSLEADSISKKNTARHT